MEEVEEVEAVEEVEEWVDGGSVTPAKRRFLGSAIGVSWIAAPTACDDGDTPQSCHYEGFARRKLIRRNS